VGARGRSMTITLDNGAVIVQAAKRDFRSFICADAGLPRRGHRHGLLSEYAGIKGLARGSSCRVLFTCMHEEHRRTLVQRPAIR
jgi:hypothetical protein